MATINKGLVALFVLAVVAAGCNKKKQAKPQPANGKAVAGTSTATAAPAKPTAAPAKPTAAPAKPRPLADLGSEDIDNALKAVGWQSKGSGGMAMGAWNTVTIHAAKGAMTAEVTLIKPTGKKPDPHATMKMAGPKEQLASFQKKGAAKLMGKALLAVDIKGNPKAAKALLAQLIAKLNLKTN